jgi:Glycosyltransferase
MSSLRILISAYACEPGKGSEPGRGWFTVTEIARRHQVWVITRANNRPAIEKSDITSQLPNLHFVYHDLPGVFLRFKKGALSTEWYYYLWQLRSAALAQKLDREVGFDLVHHATFNRYWSPSGLAFVNKPFVWGQVGGAESTPPPLRCTLGFQGRVLDALRNGVRWIAEKDPLLRLTARRATIAIGGTPETCERLHHLGASHVEMLEGSGLPTADIDRLAQLPPPPKDVFRLISIGRLISWKAYHLSLRAYLEANLPNTEYWIVGDGSERKRLEQLAASSPAGRSVRFFGKLSRAETLERLGQSSALLHPSLHDSAGWAYLEGMATGRPVVCLNIGGGATQITDECGIRIAPADEATVIAAFRDAIVKLAANPDLVTRLGEKGKQRVREVFDWRVKMNRMLEIYQAALERSR